LAARHIAAVPRRFFEHADALYRASTSSANGQGDILATFDLIFLAGWAPHDSQPKPLRPGSAKTSLIDALRPVANITKD
jgi:hypothetical protein